MCQFPFGETKAKKKKRTTKKTNSFELVVFVLNGVDKILISTLLNMRKANHTAYANVRHIVGFHIEFDTVNVKGMK